MAAVNEYLIITDTQHVYRNDGTNHADALRGFVRNPVMTYGFHGGDYAADDGEWFTVIGPGQDGPMTVKQLMSVEKRVMHFITDAELRRTRINREKVSDKIRVLTEGERVELIVSENWREPPYDLTTDAPVEVRDEGVRINNLTVPWDVVEDLVPGKA